MEELQVSLGESPIREDAPAGESVKYDPDFETIKANVELIHSLHAEMKRFADLHFVKVAAHAGIAGNERADRLARDAVRRAQVE